MMKRNPWIGTLWVVGIVLVVAAYSAGLWQSTFFYRTPGLPGPGPVVGFLLELADTLKYPALLVGFATIGGMLFLHARNHARRARKAPSR